MATKKANGNVGVLISVSPSHRTALKNLARMMSREKGTDDTMSMSDVLIHYMHGDPRFMAELRRVRNARKEA